MTEGERAFFKRRMLEELKKANNAQEDYLRNLHLGWATLYEKRLDGVPKAKVQLPG